jgi:hypothetical protein
MNTSFVRIGTFLAVSIFLSILPACTPSEPTQDPTVMLAKFEDAFDRYSRITSVMNYDDVVQILGVPGEGSPPNISTALPHGLPQEQFKSFYLDGFNISVTFNSFGTVVIKGFGWSDDTGIPRINAQTTASKYDQIRVGMSYEEVVMILGSPGVLRSCRISYGIVEKNSRFEIFSWWTGYDPIDPHMMISFWDRIVADKQK